MEKLKWLEVILEKIGKALYTTDESGRVVDVNEIALAFLGRHKEDVIGQPIQKVVPLFYTVDNTSVKLPIAKAVESNRIFTASQGMYLLNRDGKKEFATYTIVPSAAIGAGKGLMIMMCNYDFDLNLKNQSRPLLAQDCEDGPANHPAFYTKRDGQFVRVLIEDILWIEAMENYAQLVTKHDRFVVHSTMKNLAVRMSDQGFVRVHRSYIVPIDRVDAIEENRLYVGMKEIPIGKSFRQNLMKALNFI